MEPTTTTSATEQGLPACSLERRDALLAQYRRCCDDWRHHDAIIWEMPLGTVTANALIVWAAFTGDHVWLLVLAWVASAAVAVIMALGLKKQIGYARQVQARIREIEAELGLSPVTRQVGRPGMISSLMTWMLRLLAVGDLLLAVLFAVDPHALI